MHSVLGTDVGRKKCRIWILQHPLITAFPDAFAGEETRHMLYFALHVHWPSLHAHWATV